MKTNTLCLLAFLLSFSASSQESHLVISASGGDVYNTSGSISTSIGQIVYTSSSNSIGEISHGVEQANKSMVSLTVNLNVFLDGYYKNNSSPALMRPARYTNLLESGSLNPGAASDVDLITVELIRPSNLNAVAYSATSILQTNGTVRCNFPTNSLFGSYYIVVKHRAAIPIWSANPITLSAATTYNFSNNLANVYSGGDVSVPTMHTINSGLYGMWMGEMIDDDFLDAVDYSPYDADVYLSGYGGLYLLDGDFNGDSYVDAVDYGSVFDYNSNQGVYTQRPYPITENPAIPTIITTAVSAITAISASSGGVVINHGGTAVTAWGVCWSTSANPTLANSFLQNTVSSGSFSSALSGLTANTMYFVRAYATNSAGTAYGNVVSFTTNTVLLIGQSYQGGKIAYILQAGDPGYDANVQHGLIAAPSDQGVAPWGCYNTTNSGYNILGADGTAIGTGAQNTIDIMNDCSTPGIAARVCGDLVLGGYSDWYLPSKVELYKLYINRNAIGGFTHEAYWSSSEVFGGDNGLAWLVQFGWGGNNYFNKAFNQHVRAVRSF